MAATVQSTIVQILLLKDCLTVPLDSYPKSEKVPIANASGSPGRCIYIIIARCCVGTVARFAMRDGGGPGIVAGRIVGWRPRGGQIRGHRRVCEIHRPLWDRAMLQLTRLQVETIDGD